jgi:hypothetical protein
MAQEDNLNGTTSSDDIWQESLLVGSHGWRGRIPPPTHFTTEFERLTIFLTIKRKTSVTVV